MARAACRGRIDGTFFPERGQHGDEAKRICDSCTVSEECNHYADEVDAEYGVWAGRARTRRTVQLDLAQPVGKLHRVPERIATACPVDADCIAYAQLMAGECKELPSSIAAPHSAECLMYALEYAGLARGEVHVSEDTERDEHFGLRGVFSALGG